jgi:2-isopropylmalate synthase
MPRRLQIEFSRVVQAVMDDSGRELGASQLWQIFEREYALASSSQSLVIHSTRGEGSAGQIALSATVHINERDMRIEGEGAGPIDAFVNGLNKHLVSQVRVLDYHEHAVDSGAAAKAAAYLELRIGQELTLFGVGLDANIVAASLKAITSGVQRAVMQGAIQWQPVAVA